MSYSSWYAPNRIESIQRALLGARDALYGLKVTDASSENVWGPRLAAIEYRDLDEDFVRFRDDPLDDAVKSVVSSIVAADETDRDRFRAALDNDSVGTLLLYAKRRTLQARRRSSMNLVDDAIDAFALIPTIADVPWDTWLKAALFIGRSLGRDIESIAQRFGTLSTVQIGRAHV